MLKPVHELKANDVFTHLNGKDYLVVSVDWVGNDDYAITCQDALRNDARFVCDVHTQLQMKFLSAVQAGA